MRYRINTDGIVPANCIDPGDDEYIVIWKGCHETLRVGDRVKCIQAPGSMPNFLLRVVDISLHATRDDGERNVILCQANMIELYATNA